MKRKLFLVITTAIVLSVLLLYISCPSELGVDDTYEDNLLTSTLTPYDPVQLSDFTSFVGDEGVRTALTTYLEDHPDQEENLIGVVVEAFLGLMELNGEGISEADSITPYSRTLEALLYLRLYNEGITSTITDVDDPENEVVLSDVYVDNLEILLAGKLNSLSKLMLSLESLSDGVVPFDLEADDRVGISIDLESSADAWMIEYMMDETLSVEDATESEKPKIEGFASLFADFSVEMDLPATESEPTYSGKISGDANISIGTNFFFFDIDGDTNDELIRLPIIIEAKMPQFFDVDLNNFMVAFEDFLDSEEGEEEINYTTLSNLLWGAGSEGLSLKLYLGDGDSTPIVLYSGKAAMNLFIESLLGIIESDFD
ncbi:MAG: hypothetical protein PHR10_07245 [Sphaerochaetaceae bacterium]|nr:hypothetical protein [Sphaerochaetaceae bacterium]